MTAPGGFTAGAVAAGIKGNGRLDLALVTADEAVPAAAVFTSNSAAAAPVVLSRAHVGGGVARAVVLNSGCANAATGLQGEKAARHMADAAANRLGCPAEQVLVCSTGPIGTQLPVDLITDGIGAVILNVEGGAAAAEAILTTDTHSKQEKLVGPGFAVGAMAKGAGMLRPDLATMLAVITTDAEVDADGLTDILRRSVGRTFNALNVDGCESTNDTVILFASGVSGHRPSPADLEKAVTEVCGRLTVQMAADAEGASKVVTLEVAGTADDSAALLLARAMADSALVRSSFYGADPNWGRLLAAMGASRIEFDPGRVSISYDGVEVAASGVDTGADHDRLASRLGADFTVRVSVGEGAGKCRLWTTDLTPDYVRFNGERS